MKASTLETLHLASEAATEAYAAELARMLEPGDVVALVGPLGVGKTVFAKALLAALGVEGPVTSPSFALVHRHDAGSNGGLNVLHVDLYRLGDEDEVFALGLEDDLVDGAIAVVEWADRSPSLMDQAAFVLTFDHVPGAPAARTVSVSRRGAAER